LSALALTGTLTNVAIGQQAPADSAAPAGQQSLEEITVTGSRIRRTTDFDTPNPTTVVDADYLKNLGIVNVGDAVSSLPANVSNNTPATTGNANFFTGSTIANLRGLNPFFGSRTLNLVNNRRFVPTNQGDGVDLNFIPSVLIQRIDVVTGGASAAYGSGAISGVNNIFLNRTLEGGKLDVDYYQTGESDGDDRHVGAAYGVRFGERMHLVLGYEFQKSDPVGCIDAREWCARNTGYFQGAAGQPSLILGDNVRAGQMSTTGVFTNGNPAATTTLQANAAGTGTTVFNLPQAPYNASAFNLAPGGDGRPIYRYTNLTAPVKRNIGTGVFTFQMTDATRLSVDVSWGQVDTANITGALDDQFRFITADNAYVLQSPALQAAVGPVVATINKDWTSQVDSRTVFTTEVKRAAIALDGHFGDSSWTWEGYYQFGETDRQQLVADNRHLNAYNMAVDAVVDNRAGSSTFGQPVCRVTRDGFAAAAAANPFGGYGTADPRIAVGCIPINPFGSQPISQAAHDWSFGFLREDLNYKQSVLAGSVSGTLFAGVGAGEIQAAAGVEYRTEKGRNIAAEELPDYLRTDFLIQYGESFSGDVDVTEGFFEVNVPLLRDRPGAKLVELNLAARESHYKNKGLEGTTGESRSHDMFTWKVSGVFDPLDWLRFRGSRSRDSRAANFRELYYGQIINAGGAFGFCGPGFMVDACTWSLEGNVDLKPEKADTTTFGIVLTPLENLQFAADYFQIKISEAIQQANVNRVISGCRDSNIAEFCNLIQFGDPALVNPANPRSNITFIRALAFNGSAYEYKGIDFSGTYTWQIRDADSVSFRLLATRMIDQNFENVPGAPFVNVVGQTGTGNSFLSDNQPTADWVANLSATYNHGPFSLTGNMRYVSDGVMDYLGIEPGDPRFSAPPVGFRTVSENRVPSYTVFGLSGSYSFENLGPVSSLQVFAALDNVFDKDPPTAVGGGAFGPSNTNGGTNAVFFDTLGRAVRVGVRTTF
jgi:iron complex outermembrane recepter protein